MHQTPTYFFKSSSNLLFHSVVVILEAVLRQLTQCLTAHFSKNFGKLSFRSIQTLHIFPHEFSYDPCEIVVDDVLYITTSLIIVFSYGYIWYFMRKSTRYLSQEGTE